MNPRRNDLIVGSIRQNMSIEADVVRDRNGAALVYDAR